MGKQSEDLKQVAQLRKAVLPLIKLLSSEAVLEVSKRLDTIEESLTELAKRDMNVTVKAPEVHIDNPFDVQAFTSAIEKSNDAVMAKSSPAPAIPQYEPHDQSTGAIKYNGFVASDGSWYIQRLAKGQQRYAKGKGDYNDAWAKKGGLKYTNIDGS